MSPLSTKSRWAAMRLAFLILAVANAAALYWLWESARLRDEDRRAAIIAICRNNHAQDNVLRAILRPSIDSEDPVTARERLRLVHTYERVLGKTPGDKSVRQMRLELVEHLMRPLGGFRTNTREQRAACERQLRTAGLEP